jgi:predicted phosphate transport protein (TIGR00153 family)
LGTERDVLALSWLIPQEKKFFDLLIEQSANVKEGVKYLNTMMGDFTDLEQKALYLKKMESKGDSMVHHIHEELNRTFITPIDREDIVALTSSLDDILDIVDNVADNIVLFKIKQPTKAMVELVRNLNMAMEEVDIAIHHLKDMKKPKDTKSCCVEINRLEHEGDTIYRKAIADLFETEDAKNIIKLKELYTNIEFAADRCEDVADVLNGILIKYA